MSIAERMAGLDAIGITPAGVMRLAWTKEDAACREWFRGQAGSLGLRVETDPAGNIWAHPPSEAPWFGVGSHLDSVRGGGRFDGPLGVACGFEVAAATERPVAVIAFADEEGARWGTPTFGSKALAARLDLPAVLDRTDEDGVTIAEAMRSSGVDPSGVIQAPGWLEKLSGFVEIHIDQALAVARAEVPIGIVSELAERMRIEVTVHGRADHAGTTPPEEREDALLGAARMIVTSDQIAAELGRLTVTAARIVVEPNASTTIAARVRVWIDARSEDPRRMDAWFARLQEVEVGAKFTCELASRSARREFSPELRRALAAAGEAVVGTPIPEVPCFAGHDAGVIAEHLPAAMLLVRNPTGVSHAPAEEVDLDDAAAAVAVLARTLESR